MPTADKRSAQTRRRQETADGIDRLSKKLDGAQKALAGLRDDVADGGRRLLDDVETMIRSARDDATKLGKDVRADIGGLGDAIAGAGERPATRRRTPPRTRSTAAKRTSTKAS